LIRAFWGSFNAEAENWIPSDVFSIFVQYSEAETEWCFVSFNISSMYDICIACADLLQDIPHLLTGICQIPKKLLVHASITRRHCTEFIISC
jgi:hypothetical protein